MLFKQAARVGRKAQLDLGLDGLSVAAHGMILGCRRQMIKEMEKIGLSHPDNVGQVQT